MNSKTQDAVVTALVDKIESIQKENRVLRDIIEDISKDIRIPDKIALPTGEYSLVELDKITRNYEELQRHVHQMLDRNYHSWMASNIVTELMNTPQKSPSDSVFVITKLLFDSYHYLEVLRDKRND